MISYGNSDLKIKMFLRLHFFHFFHLELIAISCAIKTKKEGEIFSF